MTTHITKNTNLLFDHDDTIVVTGHGTELGMSYLSHNDAIYVRGVNDSVTMSCGTNHIYDQGIGTKLFFNAPAFNDVVSGLQNDCKGIVEFIAPTPVTYKMDGHGGVMASANGLSVDFLGFRSIAQLESHVRTA